MKNRDGAGQTQERHPHLGCLVGALASPATSVGDVILNEQDIVSKRIFQMVACPAPGASTCTIPSNNTLKVPRQPLYFLRRARKGRGSILRLPRSLPLFLFPQHREPLHGGRCVSVTHEALGTVRVMKTCGMMGEVVGRAASICIKRDCLPRDVYKSCLDDLIELINLPGKAFRPTVNDKITIPSDAMSLAGAYGAPAGLNPKKFPGVVDDAQALLNGKWAKGNGLKPYFHYGYRYSSDPEARPLSLWKPPRPDNTILRLPTNLIPIGGNPFP